MEKSTVVWTIEHGAYTIEESTSEVDILYQRDAKNNGSNYEACASTERVTHKEQPRNALTEEERREIAQQVILMYSELEKLLKCVEYTNDLRTELEESNPHYLKILQNRRIDMERTDHGIVIAGETCSGKSTLINKILGKPIFLGRNLESTSTICKIRNSGRIIITTNSIEKETKTIDLTNRCDLNTKEGVKILQTHLTKLIDRTSSRENSQFEFVDVGFPIPFLKNNVVLVDTPGIGGKGDVTHKLIEYLPNALFIIFMIDVSRAGGLENDRIPKILRDLTHLHLENSMPCFDPKDVIFITNKWDTIYNEEGLEDEISLTWEAFLSDIKRIWPFVKEENVFRLNLKEVSMDPERKNDSITQFKRFRRILDSNITAAENRRVVEHLSFLCKILKNVWTGLDARRKIGKRSETEQFELATSHHKKIKELKDECKQMNDSLHTKNKQVIKDVAQEVYENMSTDTGKTSILNPPGRRPIITVEFTTLEKEIEARVMQYIGTYLQSENVLERFRKIREDIIKFHRKVSSDLSDMEADWTSMIKLETELDWEDHTPLLLQIPVFALIAAAGIVLSPIIIPICIYLSRDSVKKNNIEEKYQATRESIRGRIFEQLESKFGEYVDKMIDKVTKDLLPKRINYLERMISQLLTSRRKILANMILIDNLKMKVKSIYDAASDLNVRLSTLK